MKNPTHKDVIDNKLLTVSYKGKVYSKIVKDYCTYMPILGQLSPNEYNFMSYQFEEKILGLWDMIGYQFRWENN